MILNKGNMLRYILVIGVVLFLLYVFTVNKVNKFEEVTFPNETIKQLEQDLKKTPDDLDKIFKLALEYYKIEDWSKAEGIYKNLLQIKPQENLYRLNLGDVYMMQNKFDEAAATYLEAIQVNKKEMEAYSRLVELYIAQNNKEQARQLLKNLQEIEGDKTYSTAYENDTAVQLQARIYKFLEEYENAISYYQKLLDKGLGIKIVIEEQIQTLKKLMEEKK